MAGHSLGEYTALVCAGALDFADAIALVADRGRFMQEAVPAGQGAMAAILGVDDAVVIDVCARAAQGDVVSAVNFNSPGQVVIAGSAAAVQRAVELAKASGAKRAVVLPVSVPSHCSLMQPAADRLAQRLAGIEVKVPNIPVINNVDVVAAQDPAAIRDALVRQLHSPVRWVETIQKMGNDGVRTLVECGPGKVLIGLNKRIDKEMGAGAILDSASLDQLLTDIR
jgi:[acyl-carrier-protein] S-malonyltransferase